MAELVLRGIRAQGWKTQALESEFCLPIYHMCDHVPAAQSNPKPELPMCGKDTTYLVSERSGEVTYVQCKGQVWLLAPHPHILPCISVNIPETDGLFSAR